MCRTSRVLLELTVAQEEPDEPMQSDRYAMGRLKKKQGREAAAEFQRLLDHPEMTQ